MTDDSFSRRSRTVQGSGRIDETTRAVGPPIHVATTVYP